MSERKITSRPDPKLWTIAPWRVLSQREIEPLNRQSTMETFEKHQAIFKQGDQARGLYCIMTGEVLLDQIDSAGTHTAFRVAVSGEHLGFRSLFAEQPHAATARAIRRSRVSFVPALPLRKILESNTQLACELLKIVATDPGPIYAPLLRNPLLPVSARLLHLLLILQRQYQQSARSAGPAYELPLSKSSIAALIGARRETVSRLFQQFESAGLCSAQKSRVIIPSAKRLAETTKSAQQIKLRQDR